MRKTTHLIYQEVIQDVINKVKQDFVNESNEQVLFQLQNLWECKLNQSGVLTFEELPLSTPSVEEQYNSHAKRPHVSESNLVSLRTSQNLSSNLFRESESILPISSDSLLTTDGRPAAFIPLIPSLQRFRLNSTRERLLSPSSPIQTNTTHSITTPNLSKYLPNLMNDTEPSPKRLRKDGFSPQLVPSTSPSSSTKVSAFVRNQNETIAQFDGFEEQEFYDDNSENNDAEILGLVNRTNKANKPELHFPIDSTTSKPIDDISSRIVSSTTIDSSVLSNFGEQPTQPLSSSRESNSEDEDEEPSTENLILCQFEKITRIKSKRKCLLKDGIMHLNGKDYLFSMLNGECEF